MDHTEENSDKDFAGKNGFTWFIGIVEAIDDPLKLGRCRVRCVGWHTENKSLLPTKSLPWAQTMLSGNNPHPYAPRQSDMIVGFFADGQNAQEPIIIGVLPGIPLTAANPQQGFNDPRTSSERADVPRTPASKTYSTDGTGIKLTEKSAAESNPKILDEPTTSRLARNDENMSKTFIQERKNNVVKSIPTVNGTWTEPTTEYAAKYPYNRVMESESGHILEFDDTYKKERIHLAHRNGSFQEWFPAGDKVEKVTKDNYEIIMGNDSVYIMGKCQITIQGDAELYVKKSVSVKVDGNYDLNVTGTIRMNGKTVNINKGTKGAARIGDTADTGDEGTGGEKDVNSAGTNKIETGSGTVFIGD